MIKTEVICNLIKMAISLIIAIIILSDRISERDNKYRISKIIIALILSGYSSIGIATFIEYYYATNFKIWEVFTIGFSIFSIYFVISVAIGFYKKRKQETRWIKENSIDIKNIKESFAITQREKAFVDRDNYCIVANECNIVNIKDAKR